MYTLSNLTETRNLFHYM